MARPRKPDGELELDLDLEDLPAPARWREWMGRVEAVIFASAEPVLRESLARVVGRGCNLDLIIDDIRDELSGRPYETRLRRRRMELSDETRVRRRHPGRVRRAAKDRIVALKCARADGDRVFSADHPRRAVAVLGQGGFARRDRRAARRRVHRRRAAQPDARRALRLRHHAGVLGAIRVREPARSARHREARGCGTASGGPAKRVSTAIRWRPSYELCWDLRVARSRRTSRRKMRREARFYAKSPCAPWDCLLGCNLAKVGVEGSNPFVRSKISHRYQWFITIPGPFYASPSLELKRGKQGEAAKSET